MSKHRNSQHVMGIHKKRIRHRRHRHIFTKLIFSVIGLVILFYVAIALINGYSFQHNSYSSQGVTRNTATRLRFSQPVNILIMGTDTGAIHRTERYGRTDEIMMNTLSPERRTMRVTSVPRDSLVWLDGHDAKINSAYEFKGAPFTQNYIHLWLNVPINGYMLINLGGLEHLTTDVGGVRVNPPLSFKYGSLHVKKNHPVRIKGSKVREYCQMRYDDPKGDYGRQLRQRQVLFQLIHQVTTVHNLIFHPTLAKKLTKYVKTNLSLQDLANLALRYRGTRDHEISTHYQGYSKQISGQDYQVLSNHEIDQQAKQINQLLQVISKSS
ncbi:MULTISPECIES: LCP family protein [Lactobacillaceae]|uniref:Cell envelope-related transcriptional attenuator domain-containing protein n=1 Tax=Acetilactobacillus jinshanensis TaxID=1720083 RepID=A0A4P6ZJ64_9LACO|nr:LCP family protein [Acetilactobacillus jinshanensis]QBP17634.1 hypothetical protein ELX58_00185 [Acetilactobacillus jinshanensis]URL61823.1 hypothetical protein HGK75_07770 [uncultured bacterium]